MYEKKIITAVIGVIQRDKKLLIAKRPSHVTMPGFWEFPGGKIEPGESYEEALFRELDEEIGIKVLGSAFLLNEAHELPDRIVQLSIWMVHHFEGEPSSCEGQEIRWVCPKELSAYEFLPTNVELLKFIRERFGPKH